MIISQTARKDIQWWLSHVNSLHNPIDSSATTHTLTTDATLEGWGATNSDHQTGGRWDPEERNLDSNINVNALELKAVLFGLKSLCAELSDRHNQFKLTMPQLWLTSAIFGVQTQIVKTFCLSGINLFASWLNHQLPSYVFWRSDPHAHATDAFTLDWNKYELCYIFRSFSVIFSTALRKIRGERAEAILVAPHWPNNHGSVNFRS